MKKPALLVAAGQVANPSWGRTDMQILLDRSGMASEVGINAAQVRKLILAVFPNADVRHRWQAHDVEQLTIDDRFAMVHTLGQPRWRLSGVKVESTVPPSIVHTDLGDFASGESAVKRLVVVMATARVRAAIGKAVQS